MKLLNQKMTRLEYESLTGKLFNVLFNDKTNKVIGIEYEDVEHQEKLRSLMLYTYISLAQLKATISRLIPGTKL